MVKESQSFQYLFLAVLVSAGLLIGSVFIVTNSTESIISIKPWLSKYSKNVSLIVHYMTKGTGQGEGWNWLANITDKFGCRQVGSKALDDAIDFNVANLKKQGFSNVHTEDVTGLPHWIRGREEATLLSPRNYSMAILGVGGTEGTGPKGLKAAAIVVESFDELDKLAPSGVLKDKIVVYNQPWVNYGVSVAYRSGAKRAAKYGAKAVLIRSVTSFSVYSPHTGMGNHDIPAACITVEDAEILWRMQKRGDQLIIQLIITSGTHGTITSRNTVFELPGTEKPHEIIMLSGHYDSWDVGQGAMDDGGGVAVMWHAANTIKRLGLPLKRTIRIIMWTAEEIGHVGAEYYYKQHKSWNNETFVFVSESDEGVFRPKSLNASMSVRANQSLLTKLENIGSLVQKIGIPISVKNTTSDLGDADPWNRNDGIPGFIYQNQDMYDHYFIFHHTRADTMTVLSKEDIDYTGAVFASFAYILANMDTFS